MEHRGNERPAADGIPVQATATSGFGGGVVRRRPPGRDEAVDLAYGVVLLWASAGRAVTRVPVAAAHRLPVPGRVRKLVARSRRATVARGREGRLAVERRGAELADVLVPLVLSAVLERIDVVDLVQRYVDVNRVAEQVDVDAIVARADLDRVLDRIDLDEVAGRIDLNRAATQVDLDAIVDRVDLDRVVDRLDFDPILERLDLIELARYIADGMDLPGLIRTSTGSISSDLVRGVRAHSADADQSLERTVDRFLRRRKRRTAVPTPRPPAPGEAPSEQVQP